MLLRSLWVLSWLLLPISLQAHQEPASQAIEAGIEWLAQRADDGVVAGTDDSALFWQSTSEAATAFSLENGQGVPDLSRIIPRFLSLDLSSAEYFSRAIILALRLGEPSDNAVLDQLLSRQNPDGGFGDRPGYTSTVYDTAFALHAMAMTGMRATPEGARAVAFLRDSQHADGSFAIGRHNHSTPYLSALALRALAAYQYVYNISENLERGRSYLLSLTETSSDWPTDWEAAQFLLAVVPGTTDSSLYQGSLNWLKAQQLANGSWQNDAFATALAIQALHLSENIRFPSEPDTATLRGRLVDDDSGQPLAGGTVRLSPGIDEAIPVGERGEFVIEGVQTGEYQLTYQATGYLEARQDIGVQAGQVIDLGTIALSLAPTTARISGVISDANTGEGIAGAQVGVDIAGEGFYATTAMAGDYSFSVPAGDAVVQVSAEGYHAVSASANLKAGTSVSFSPLLFPEAEEPAPLEVTGRVVDDDSGEALVGVVVRQTSTMIEVTSDDQGSFLITDAATGEQEFILSLDGYDSVRLQAMLPESGRAGLGTIGMQQTERPAFSVVQGRVLDADTGEGVSGASVSIEGLGVQADQQGHFRFDEVTLLQFVVGANAPGYMFGSTAVQLSSHRELYLELVLEPADVGGLSIEQVTTDKQTYPSHNSVNIAATVRNSTVRERRVMLYVLVRDDNGNIIDRFPATDLPPPPDDDSAEAWAHYQQHIDDAVEVLAPSETREIALSKGWNTGRQIPGGYQIIVQALDAASSQVMAEGSALFDIEPTRRLPSATLTSTPSFALMDSHVQLSLYVSLRNASNVPVESVLEWLVLTPSGQVLGEGLAPVSLQPEQTTLDLLVGELEHSITESGHYNLSLSVIDGTVPDVVSGVDLFVPPTARLIVDQALTPQEHIPGDGRRSQVRIQIRGVDGE